MDERAYRVALSTLTQPLVTIPLYRGNLLEYIYDRNEKNTEQGYQVRDKAIPEQNNNYSN